MRDWKHPETLILLLMLVAFAAGTAWGAVVEIAADTWAVDVVTPVPVAKPLEEPPWWCGPREGFCDTRYSEEETP